VPAKVSGVWVEQTPGVTGEVGAMLINSPRAKLALGAAIGAAFWMRKICGACAAAKGQPLPAGRSRQPKSAS
jgi:hypothetical protein